jgi:hypothetical protein
VRAGGASEVSVVVNAGQRGRANEVSAVVVVSAGLRERVQWWWWWSVRAGGDKRGECSGDDGKCGPEGASEVSAVVVVGVGRMERVR